MKKIDTIILGKCQAFSDWTQDFAGITNFFIVKYVISTILVLNEVWYVVYKTMKGEYFFLYIGAFIVIYFSTRLPSIVEKIETMVSSNPNFKNPLEEMMSDFRQKQILPIGTFLALLNVIFWISLEFMLNSTIFWLCITLCIYFMCCTPKPPSKSKLKKAIEKIKSIRISLPQASPTLSPG